MRNRYILLADLPLIAIAAFGAFALRFDWLFLSYRPEFPGYLAAALLLKPVVFLPFGMYQRYWRYGTALGPGRHRVGCDGIVGGARVLMAVFVGVGRATGISSSLRAPCS